MELPSGTSKTPSRQYVYRALRPDENECKQHGLHAKDEKANYVPLEHIERGNILKTQWISASNDLEVTCLLLPHFVFHIHYLYRFA